MRYLAAPQGYVAQSVAGKPVGLHQRKKNQDFGRGNGGDRLSMEETAVHAKERTDESLNTILTEGDLRIDDQLLTFALDRQVYGVPIAQVEQIISMQPVTEVPEYPTYAKGIISLRGSVVPIIDLRLRLGMTETPYTERTCIIVVNMGEVMLGCIVDEVDSVIHVAPEKISPPPQVSDEGASNRYLTGIARVENGGGERLILCLDLSRVLLQDEFAALARADGN